MLPALIKPIDRNRNTLGDILFTEIGKGIIYALDSGPPISDAMPETEYGSPIDAVFMYGCVYG